MPTEKIIKKLYDDQIEITFYPVSHQYRKDGKILISVTGATGMVDKSQALLIWASKLTKNYLLDIKDSGNQITIKDIEQAVVQHTIRKEEAADVGTLIHDWAERYAKGLNPELPEGKDEKSEKALNGILAFLKWVDENQVRFVETERLVYSREHDYVGIMDNAFTMGREDHKILHPGDYKTSGGIYSSMLYQVAGYVGAYMEEMAAKLSLELGSSFILRFAKEDKFDKDQILREAAGTFEAREITLEEQAKDFKCFLGCLELKKRDKELQSLYFNSQK